MRTFKINVFTMIFIISFIGLLSRSFQLTIGEPFSKKQAEPYQSLNQTTQTATNKPSAEQLPSTLKRPPRYALLPRTQRGSIVDQGGFPLAYSEYRYNLYLDGRIQAPINDSSVDKIAELIDLAPQRIYDNLYQGRVILLKRFADKEKAKILYKLKTSHFLTDRVLHRTYPERELMAQTLGFVGHDEHGLIGLEQYYNTELSEFVGTDTTREVQIELSIDKHLQQNIVRKLKAMVISKNAQGGVVIVQDAQTRRIRALSMYPTFDINHFTQADPKLFRNRATSYIIEPGSIFKTLFVAYLLEQAPDLDTEKKAYFCKGYYELANGEVVNCTGEHGEVSLNDIISYSCNAGMIEATQHFSKQEIREFLIALGVGTPTDIDLPGEEKGILPKRSEWGLRTQATSVIGQGIGVTPLQLMNVFTTVATDGLLRSPSLVKSIRHYQDHTLLKQTEKTHLNKTRVLSLRTTKKLREVLKHGVKEDSTGSAVIKSRYKNAFGKTSTSQVANTQTGGYYANKYHAIFAGGYPEAEPRFTALVLIILPENDYHGGRSAAPLFADILDDIIRSYRLNTERIHETLVLNIPISNETQGDTTDIIENSLVFKALTPSPTVTSPQNFGVATPTLPRFSTRKIPDFKHTSLQIALNMMDKLILENTKRDYHISYQLAGNGYVTYQEPPPRTLIEGDTTIKLFLNLP